MTHDYAWTHREVDGKLEDAKHVLKANGLVTASWSILSGKIHVIWRRLSLSLNLKARNNRNQRNMNLLSGLQLTIPDPPLQPT